MCESYFECISHKRGEVGFFSTFDSDMHERLHMLENRLQWAESLFLCITSSFSACPSL